MSNRDEHVDIASAYTSEYRATLQRISEGDACPAPFCLEQAEYHKHPILFEGVYWKVTRNTYNYQEAQHAFLIIHRTHVDNFLQLSHQAFIEFHEFVRRLIMEYQIPGAALLMRFGEKSRTGASVTHLHAHLIAGHPRSENAEIRTVVGFGPPRDAVSEVRK